MNPKTLQFILPLLVLLPLLYFRLRHAMKPQRVKPKMLLIRPAVIILVAGLVLAASPPGPVNLPWFGLLALLGAAAGWYWGKLTQLHLNPDGTVMSTGSQAGMVVLIVLVLFRYGIRAGMGADGLNLNVALITDLSITFSAVLFSARGLEIYLRAQKVMKETP